MSRLTKNYKEHLFERLKSPEEAAGYVNAALEEEDTAVLLLALRDVAEARGIGNVAAKAGLNRENVYRILSDQGNPRLSSVLALLDALDIELRVEPARRCRKAKAMATAVVAPTLDTTPGNDDKPEQFQPSLEQREGKDYGSTVHRNDEPLAA
jgi:probable addiction module antidote protein